MAKHLHTVLSDSFFSIVHIGIERSHRASVGSLAQGLTEKANDNNGINRQWLQFECNNVMICSQSRGNTSPTHKESKIYRQSSPYTLSSPNDWKKRKLHVAS